MQGSSTVIWIRSKFLWGRLLCRRCRLIRKVARCQGRSWFPKRTKRTRRTSTWSVLAKWGSRRSTFTRTGTPKQVATFLERTRSRPTSQSKTLMPPPTSILWEIRRQRKVWGRAKVAAASSPTTSIQPKAPPASSTESPSLARSQPAKTATLCWVLPLCRSISRFCSRSKISICYRSSSNSSNNNGLANMLPPAINKKAHQIWIYTGMGNT